LMFDEARTRLYYTIRVLQDYIAESRINISLVKGLSNELQEVLSLEKDVLIAAYNDSTYTIVEEIITRGFDRDYVLDILEWIKLGHYKLQDKSIQKLIDFYNNHFPSSEQINSIDKLDHNLKMQVVRMTEHLTHIKQEALDFYKAEELKSIA